MYNALFGLSQDPFSIAPDPRFLYMSERHREALAHLLYGVTGGGGFVLLTGAVGAGKTTVCRCFVEQLPPRCQLAYVFNPMLSVREMLATVCDEFGVAVEGARTVKDFVDPLNQFLLTSHAAGRNSVLVIDEAQNLAPEVLELLRLLTNLETDTRKLLQIVLIGQPELRERLATPALAQVAQRVIARYHLEPLDEAGTAQYVRHRLTVAGLVGPLPFDAAALRRVHRHAAGVPRRINLLCDRALLGAYASGRRDVSAAMVDQAAREVFDDRVPHRSVLPWAAGGVAVAALAGAAVWFGYGEALRPGAGAAPGGASAAGAAPAAARVAPAAAPATPATPAGPAASAPPVRHMDAATLVAQAGWPDEAAAWRALAARWGADAAGAAPCAALASAGLGCHTAPATLASIRQLDRPGWLPMQLAEGTAVPVLLTALGDREATLVLPDGPAVVSLATLASRWTGDFATLWRPPPGDDPAAWVLARLAEAQAGVLPDNAPLRARIEAFQRAQGLKVDGLAGPLTMMQLNRAAGVSEPRLDRER